MGNFFYHFKVMLWRNFLLKRRLKGKTVFELMMPALMTLVLTTFRIGEVDKIYKAQKYPVGNALLNNYSFTFNTILGVAPDSKPVREFMELLNKFYHNSFSIQWFPSEDEMNECYVRDPTNFTIGIIFTEDPYNNSSYVLRFSSGFFASTDTYFGKTSDCRTNSENPFNEINFACPALEYYSKGFVALQESIDKLLLKKMGININTETALKLYPKEEYIDSATYVRSVMPLYLILAFTPLISMLTLLIVEEKEKKIKEGMLMMGLNSLAYWLAWFIVESVMVFLISVIMTGIILAFKIFPNSNIIIIFILILLFGLSIIMLSFMATPFFNSSKVASSVMGFAVLLLGLFHLLAVYLEDKINSATFYLLALLSPTAYSLGFENVISLDDRGKMSWDELFVGVFSVGGSMLMLFIDVILYGLLAYYFDSVIPGEYGPRQKPWFCFLPSFWCSNKSTQNNDMFEFQNSLPQRNNADIEAIPIELQEKEAIRIMHITKMFKGHDGTTVKAVDGINLSIYEDQITALLGHNGAGKTTLISMLVGTLPPTSGTAYMYGDNITNINSLLRIRSKTGVCLQENILLNELNAEEHLRVFAMLKRVPPEKLNSEVEQTLFDIGLADSRSVPSKQLSGGNKRKLSVGIALIGDPKIVYLDEPTSGVDPYSRRLLWTYLQHKKKGKVIVLTTHSMDEADILTDRKAIISKGKLKCAGSSLFLKSKFGIGYHLTLTVNSSASFGNIHNLIVSTIATAKASRESSLELSFILPLEETNRFPLLFSNIEQAISDNQLGIINYAVSMTTLEEVFLNLAEEEEQKEENSEISTTNSVVQDSANILDPFLMDYSKINLSPSFMQSFLEFLKVRFILFIRQPLHIFPIIVLPLISIIVSYFMMKSTENMPLPHLLQLSPKLYDEFDFKLYGNKSQHQFSIIYKALLDEVQNVAYLKEAPIYDNLITSCMAVNLNHPNTQNKITWDWLFNDTCVYSLPVLQNIMSNVLLRGYSNSTQTISVATYPLPQNNKQTINVILIAWAIIVGIVLPYISPLIAMEVVEDRESKVKNQLRVSGLDFHTYWSGILASHSIVFLFSIICMIIILIALKVEFLQTSSSILATCLLFVMHIPSALLCCYVISYIFDKHETAKSVLPSLCSLPAIFMLLPVCILDVVGKTETASILHYVFSAISPFYLPVGGLYFIAKVSLVEEQFEQLSISTGVTISVFSWENNVSALYIIMAVQIIVYYILLRIADVIKSGGQVSEALFMKSNASNYSTDIPIEEDDDVKAERERIKATHFTPSAKSIVVLDQVRKVYRPFIECKKHAADKIAVRNTSLGVDSGTIFGLLGPNGAGKTSTAKMIIAEEAPTCGKIYVAGYEIKSNLSRAYKEIGYCPQEDALWKRLTVEEHIHLYAAIKGVPKSQKHYICKQLLNFLNIEEHAKKRAQTLSGGTKRKLCFILSILGNPKAVLLDEPSTGIDPQSKRYLWNFISSMFPANGSHSVILTTHSMEEADALCTRIGIMVKGVMRCLGSTQHLKNKYGTGYTLDLKVGRSNDGSSFISEVKAYIQQSFNMAEVKEEFQDRITFNIPQSIASLANVFSCLEKAKSMYNIEEYSFSQTTLEQVFLGFAKEQEEHDIL